jgi:hypothetical protein
MRAVLDADVLVPILTCDLLMSGAKQGLYEPIWSSVILVSGINEKDQQVLAVGLAADADLVVTEGRALRRQLLVDARVGAVDVNRFLADQAILDPDSWLMAVAAMANRRVNPPITIEALLESIARLHPQFAETILRQFRD